MLIKNLPDFG